MHEELPLTPEVTPEVQPTQGIDELKATIEEQAKRLEELSSLPEMVKQINERLTPPEEPIPDEQFKPSSWKDLHEREQKVAEETAIRILEQAKERENKLREEEETKRRSHQEKLEQTVTELEKEGYLKETKAQGDTGDQQREQLYGAALRLNTTDIKAVATFMKPYWDQGYSYDYKENKWVQPNPYGFGSMATPPPVGSSASRSPQPAPSGPVVARNLDQAEELWNQTHGL